MALSKIQAESMNLADTYAFSGTVSGVGGITHVDQWRLTSSFTGGAVPIGSNLERVDTTGQASGLIGSAMTFNSGIFTFPVTGKWLVTANYIHYIGGSSRYQSHYISVTQDNSNYVIYAVNTTGISQAESGTTYTSDSHSTVVDVTDTSLVKCRFEIYLSSSSVGTVGDSTHNATHFTFMRLGDT